MVSLKLPITLDHFKDTYVKEIRYENQMAYLPSNVPGNCMAFWGKIINTP